MAAPDSSWLLAGMTTAVAVSLPLRGVRGGPTGAEAAGVAAALALHGERSAEPARGGGRPASSRWRFSGGLRVMGSRDPHPGRPARH